MGKFDDYIGRHVRNLIWSIPGGRQAFPQGRNETIRWGRDGSFRDHLAGRTVLGAAVTGGVGGLMGGGDEPGTGFRPQPATRPIPAPWMRPSQIGPPAPTGGRSGSVVAQGFIGGQQPRAGEMGPPAPSRSGQLGLARPQAPSDRTELQPQRPGGRPGRLGHTGGEGGHGGGGTGEGGGGSPERHLGAGQLGRAGDEALGYYTGQLRNRNGLMQEY